MNQISYPPTGPVHSRIRFDRGRLSELARAWLKQSRTGLKVGTFVGLVLAAGLSVFVFLEAIARHSIWFPSAGLSVWQVAAVYFVAFTAGGAFIGLLSPLFRTRIAAVIGGILGAILVYALIQVVTDGLGKVDSRGAISLGMAYGGPIGYLLHYGSAPGRRWSQRREVLSILAMGLLLFIAELWLNW